MQINGSQGSSLVQRRFPGCGPFPASGEHSSSHVVRVQARAPPTARVLGARSAVTRPAVYLPKPGATARRGMKYSFTLEVLTPNHPVALTPSTRPTSPLQKRRVTLRSSAVSSSQQTSSRIQRDVGPGRMTTLPSPPCGSGGSRVPGMSFCGTAGNACVPPSPASYLCTGGQRVAWGHGPRHGQEPKRPGCLLTSCSRHPGPRHPPPAPRHPPLALSRTRGGQYFTPRTW